MSEEEKHLIAVASNPQQMQVAQQDLIAWTDRKLEAIEKERLVAWENLETAKKHKWKHSGWQQQHNKLVDQHNYYEKLKACLEAGYTIIPNFENIDIFAIRTTSERPDRNWVSQDALHGRAIPQDQTTESPPAGEGQFVNASAEYEQRKIAGHVDKQGQQHYLQQAWATQHQAIDFPFKLVKPEIMNATKRAMDFLVFDDIGVVPGRRRARRGDPMIIGRIHCGAHTHKHTQLRTYDKTLSFLVTWWIDTKAL